MLNIIINIMININNISAECVPASQCRQYEGDGKRLGEAQRLNLETSY